MPNKVARITAALAIVAVSVLPGGAEGAADREVKARDNFFTPAYSVITVGDSVTWVNDGADRHTVTSYDDAPQTFDSSPQTVATCDDANPITTEDCLEPGEQYGPIEFTVAGTYRYRCKVHGDATLTPDRDAGAQEQPCGMCGIIRVVEERQDTETPRRQSPPPRRVETRRASPSASPSGSPSESPTLDEDGSPIAAPGAQGSGTGGRLLLALLLLGALGGAGYWTWRKYLA